MKMIIDLTKNEVTAIVAAMAKAGRPALVDKIKIAYVDAQLNPLAIINLSKE